ncbi:MAG TPA: glycosyltransferase family 4 protein [Terriglobales bacterium]|nr:glycosyltransferase family 4 protein [Terriglobales bacterium]
MRIAQVAPLFESVPPKLYGGTERVVSWLTEELVRLGHDVTLFASGDSMTTAKLVSGCPQALRLSPDCVDHLAHHFVLMEQVLRRKDNFDLIHFHTDYMHYPLSRREKYVQITTLHGRLDIPDLVPLYQVYREMPVISISDAQRDPLPHLNWQGTVHHGLPIENYKFFRKNGSYLAFLGRTSPEKGLDQAIEIARRAQMPLKIAAKIDKADQEYFDTIIRPALDGSDTEFIGEIGYPAKNEFLGNAAALLFPIAWPEPFGIVMIEAMACGTPVIAYPFGSVPEVIVDGVSGFLVSDEAGAVEAIKNIDKLDRRKVRKHFEQNFTADRMALDYLKIYERMLSRKKSPLTASSGVLNWMKLPSPSSSTT